MAQIVGLRQKDTGLTIKGFVGFSWTTLFFGPFPALFRQDYLTFVGFFVVTVILGILTMGIGNAIAGIAWAFMYNKYYTRKLLERGYQLEGSGVLVNEAAAKLGIVAAS